MPTPAGPTVTVSPSKLTLFPGQVGTITVVAKGDSINATFTAPAYGKCTPAHRTGATVTSICTISPSATQPAGTAVVTGSAIDRLNRSASASATITIAPPAQPPCPDGTVPRIGLAAISSQPCDTPSGEVRVSIREKNNQTVIDVGGTAVFSATVTLPKGYTQDGLAWICDDGTRGTGNEKSLTAKASDAGRSIGCGVTLTYHAPGGTPTKFPEVGGAVQVRATMLKPATLTMRVVGNLTQAYVGESVTFVAEETLNGQIQDSLTMICKPDDQFVAKTTDTLTATAADVGGVLWCNARLITHPPGQPKNTKMAFAGKEVKVLRRTATNPCPPGQVPVAGVGALGAPPCTDGQPPSPGKDPNACTAALDGNCGDGDVPVAMIECGGKINSMVAYCQAFGSTPGRGHYITKYLWSFEGGNVKIGNLQMEHTYLEPGRKVITLVVENDAGKRSQPASSEVTVPVQRVESPPPRGGQPAKVNILITPDPRDPCDPSHRDQIVFEAPASYSIVGQVYSPDWPFYIITLFEGGKQIDPRWAGTTLIHDFNNVGEGIYTYHVEAAASGSYPPSQSPTLTVVVVPKGTLKRPAARAPQAATQAPGSAPCSGQPPEQSPPNVCTSAEGGCEEGDLPVAVLGSPLWCGGYPLNTLGAFCDGSRSFAAKGRMIARYLWSFAGGNVEPGPARAFYVYPKPGDYVVTLIVEDNAGKRSRPASHFVRVPMHETEVGPPKGGEPPKVDISVVPDPRDRCNPSRQDLIEFEAPASYTIVGQVYDPDWLYHVMTLFENGHEVKSGFGPTLVREFSGVGVGTYTYHLEVVEYDTGPSLSPTLTVHVVPKGTLTPPVSGLPQAAPQAVGGAPCPGQPPGPDTRLPKTPTPQIVPAGGKFLGSRMVRIVAGPKDQVYYSVDGYPPKRPGPPEDSPLPNLGQDPVPVSFQYDRQFEVSGSCRVTAVAYRPGHLPSDPAGATFTIEDVTVSTFLAQPWTAQVLLLGWMHENTSAVPGQIRQRVAQLKRQGITHVVLEIPANVQSQIDQGTFRASDSHGPDYVAMVREFQRAGIVVVAADLPTPWPNPLTGRFNQQREEHIASVIAGILRENPKARILLLIGGAHVNNLAAMLRDQGTSVRGGQVK